ncbi:SUMO-interacting motif-containing protein 1 [Bagarius yarrelli]|uniref:SUMO-interacting motif-containing protein 1 n=1 Tax=Bagarius yarrelli TaxID=175774 RepID=A0A556U8Y9_BAGYA|nr:SUMO-interacting motif-containing protein 1 [Bagarius yarrelli]
MTDVISLSSGSDKDSDVEFVSSYKDDGYDGIPFNRAKLLPVTPVLIDISEHHFSTDRKPCTIEIINLNNKPKSRVRQLAKTRRKNHLPSYAVNFDENVICLGDGNGVQSPDPASCYQENSNRNQQKGIQSRLQASSPKDSSENSEGILELFEVQKISTSPLAKKNVDLEESLDSSHNCSNVEFSPISSENSYYCPSEIDEAVFSDESLIFCDNVQDHKYTLSGFDKTKSPFELFKCVAPHKEPLTHALSPHPQTQTNFQPEPQVLPTTDRTPQTAGPMSTELLAGDFSESDLDMKSPPISAVNSPYTLSPPPHMPLGIGDSALVLKASSTDADNLSDEPCRENKQQISLVQFRKLKYLLGAQDQDLHNVKEEDNEFGMPEPLCRLSLSLVYSTIDENYTEGTLQLLSDLIQPCYYPPVDITAHLLRRILLEPQCTRVLALEAYNLLMRTQKYRPADKSTISWDWELISSIMSEQDRARKLHCEVRCLLFQYVLQVLEDDFYVKLPMLQLHLSVANEMLSCDYRFRQVRELLIWLVDAAKQSSENEKMQNSERNCCLRMLLILQRMLLLAMEVDLRPTCSSSKLSQELYNSLNSMAPCRRLRFLLLSTLQSNLLRCKLVQLLLNQSCSQQRVLPMSFNLLLHFLHTSTLAPDPSDGPERWKRWDELLQLAWMLMLSYQEVITGHLRYSITERFKVARPLMWTQNDQVTRAAVQEAANAFLSRAVEDLGHDLPVQIQESLSQLQKHLLSICPQ